MADSFVTISGEAVATSKQSDGTHILKTTGTVPAGSSKAQSSSTATRTTVATSTVAAIILAANTSRVGATIKNDSSVILYLVMATSGTPSSSNFDIDLLPGEIYVLDAGYTGQVRGATASSTGNARNVEYT